MTVSISSKGLINSIALFIDRYHMIESGSRIVCGVSGGPDSVALLIILNSLKSKLSFGLTVAHLDHALRPESGQDGEFVCELSRQLEIECHVKKVDVRTRAAQSKISVEEAGRRARYAFFEELRMHIGADVIATGHQKDDRLETFFIRVFRGSTLTGLGGIAPIRGRIIRPLIETSREEILDFLIENSIPFREDPTNMQSDTDRNFVRNSIFPLVRQRFPGFTAPLERTMEMVSQEERFLDRLSREAYERTVNREEPGEALVISKLSEEPDVIAARVVLAALYELSGPTVRWRRSHVDAIMNVARGKNPSARLNLASGIVLFREYDRLILGKEDFHLATDFEPIVIHGPGQVTIRPASIVVEFGFSDRTLDEVKLADDRNSTFFDADRVDFPLLLRPPRPGDRFRPWGIEGSRKLKKILIDLKIPAADRPAIPLLVQGDRILWILGIRRSRTAPVTERTRRILLVRMKRKPDMDAP